MPALPPPPRFELSLMTLGPPGVDGLICTRLPLPYEPDKPALILLMPGKLIVAAPSWLMHSTLIATVLFSSSLRSMSANVVRIAPATTRCSSLNRFPPPCDGNPRKSPHPPAENIPTKRIETIRAHLKMDGHINGMFLCFIGARPRPV